MKSKPIIMLQLKPDTFGPDLAPLDQLPTYARFARHAVTREGVREWVEASPMASLDYKHLRWVLDVVSRAQVAQPRRLTWWERITGRLKP